MTRRIRILPQAKKSLSDIAAWTVERFGEAQAIHYGAAFRSRFRRIADKQAASKPLVHVTGLERHRGVEIARSGSHYILFAFKDGDLFILDVIHTKRNLLSVDLADPETDDG